MKINVTFALLGAFGLSSLASAASPNEVMLIQGQEKGGRSQMMLDFMSSGEATAFEFEIVLPKGVTSVDTAKCVSELPATHVGACQYNGKEGRVVVMVYSNDNVLLPAGPISIGRVGVVGLSSGAVSVDKVNVAGGQGTALESSALTDVEGAPRSDQNLMKTQ